MMHIPIKPNKKHIFGCESCFVKRQKLRENNRPEKMDEKKYFGAQFFLRGHDGDES